MTGAPTTDSGDANKARRGLAAPSNQETDMTDTSLSPAHDPDRFVRDYFVYQGRVAELHPLNKANLFERLSAAGVTRVVVTFDGYADSGQLESVQGFAGDEACALPSTTVQIHRLGFRDPAPTVSAQSIGEAIETLAYDFLEEKHGGWENNAGAFGEFVFDVAAGEITLDYNERFEDSENYSYVF